MIDGVPEYKGMFDVLIKTSRNEGIPALWKGFTPYFARTGPQERVYLLMLEFSRKFSFRQKFDPYKDRRNSDAYGRFYGQLSTLITRVIFTKISI